ncbi:transporter substrate-binding domain-containing protein [Actinomadura darangshiensis]|uniref:Transporter substrate-binding domain-containing protein n=1 Tax=Actinomadura darangshiensis TaxID=705336 RepID=A0A4R5B9S0_9ACTN|nr:ABC transporter substrate-binding protein [Actinomadura darangshiensis]TDD80454.1 transporter substrate-binding domain-containing protein [Actinomadura darangshiensis]
MSLLHRDHSRRPFVACAAAAALALTALTGCGAGGGAGEVSADGTAEVKLGVIPIIDIAPVKLGVTKGVFARHKLKVTTQDAQGGAAIVPAVVSGDFQFGYSNIVSLLVAREKGVPVTMVSVGARASGDPMDDGSGQLMTRDSTIAKVADLKGRKIAVNTLKGINEVAVASVLKKNGLRRGDAELVEVPIPNMPAALKNGQVDAAMLSEPFITVAEGQGAKRLPVSYAGMGAHLPFAGWFTSKQYAGKNPDVVKRFTAALKESMSYAESHPDEARGALNGYLKLEPGLSDKVTLPGWNPEAGKAEIAPLARLTVDTGLIGSTRPLDDLFDQ